MVAVADSQNLQHGLDQNDQKAYEHGDGGIGSTLSEESIQSLLDHRQQLASDFSSALVHEVIVFDHDAPNQNFPRGISGVPSPAKSKTTTIKTVMCDLTSQLLAEMTSFARSIQGLSSLESPKTPGQNIHRPLARYGETSRPASSERSQQSSDGRGTDHRMSMPAHLLANRGSRSGTPEGRPMSPPGGTQTPPTDVNGSTSTPSTSPSRVTDRSRPMSRDRASLQGFGSNSLAERERKKHRGRIGIVIGLLYLLAGRWPDAVKELSESGSVAKANNDHVWHGKALDYLLVTSLLYAWAGLDFQVSTRIVKQKIPISSSGTKYDFC